MTLRFSSLSRAVILAAVALAISAPLGIAQPKAEGTAGPAAASRGEPGVLVASVQTDGPAAKAGIARGDIILEASGSATDTPDALMKLLDSKKPGDKVLLKVRHGDAMRSLSVTLGEEEGRAYLGVVLFPPPRGPFGGPEPERWGRFGWGHPFASGAEVVKVVPASPADKAGVKPGDLIVAVDGLQVDFSRTLGDLIAAKKVGDIVALSVRSGEPQKGEDARELKVTLGKSPDKDAPYLGVEYRMGGPRYGQGPGPEVTAGALVAKIADDGPAAKAGVKERDLITAVEGVRIASPQDVVDAVAKHSPGDTLALSVYRMAENAEKDISVILGENPSDKAKAYLGVSMSAYVGMEGPEYRGEDRGWGRMPFQWMPRFRGSPPRDNEPSPGAPSI
jgi:S1-C subfamily serine protease